MVNIDQKGHNKLESEMYEILEFLRKDSENVEKLEKVLNAIEQGQGNLKHLRKKVLLSRNSKTKMRNR